MKRTQFVLKHFISVSLMVLAAISTVFAQDKVMVRTDRDIYIGGETMWLSVNCIESQTNAPSKISQVVYVELLNKSNWPVIQTKLELNNGCGSTLVSLSDTLSTGNYVLRAYSNWMQNLNAKLFFKKEIAIVNPFAQRRFPERETAFVSDTALIYPEGGCLVAGKKNKILIQALDVAGKGISVKGQIQSEDSVQLAQVLTNVQGFSCISFVPTEEQRCRFVFTYGGKESSVLLPKAERPVSALYLDVFDKTGFTFRIVSNGEMGSSQKGKVHIVTPEGLLLESKEISFIDGAQVKFDASNRPFSNLSALLIDPAGKVVSSRYFANSERFPEAVLSTTLNKTTYGEREQVRLQIERAKDLRNVSVSVIKSCLDEDQQACQLSRLNRSFVQDVAGKGSDYPDLNDLMLAVKPLVTYVDRKQALKFVPEPYTDVIDGVLRSDETGEPLANKVLTLSYVGNSPDLHFAVTDSLGKFRFEVKQTGEKEIVIQPLNFKKGIYNYTIDLTQEFSNVFVGKQASQLAVSKERMRELNQCIVNMQITSWFRPNSGSPLAVPVFRPFFGNPEFEIPIQKFIELPTMEEVIRELVTSVRLRKRDGKFEIRFVGDDITEKDGGLVLVDGVPVWDHDEVLKIIPSELSRIDVLNLDYYMTDVNLGPILSIITNKANLSAMDLDKAVFRQARGGFAAEWQFQSPDYANDSIRVSRTPDFRNTLYWNPDVDFGNSNQVTLSFYTADEDANYAVLVEGINALGEIERRIQYFDVVR